MQTKLLSRIFAVGKIMLASPRWRDSCSSPGLRVCAPMTTLANGASPGPIIIFTKPSSVMGVRAGKRTTLAMNCTKRANIAGAALIVGGMNTSIVGIPIAIGTTTTTIMTAIAIVRRTKSAIERSQQELRQAADLCRSAGSSSEKTASKRRVSS